MKKLYPRASNIFVMLKYLSGNVFFFLFFFFFFLTTLSFQKISANCHRRLGVFMVYFSQHEKVAFFYFERGRERERQREMLLGLLADFPKSNISLEIRETRIYPQLACLNFSFSMTLTSFMTGPSDGV